MQVSNTSGGRDNLNCRVSRSLLLRDDHDDSKPVLVVTIEGLLGFFDAEGDGATGLFVNRPHVQDFLQFLSRLYTLASWTIDEGVVLSSKLLLTHPLLFAGWGPAIPDPDDVARASGCDLKVLSEKNVLYLVSDQHDDVVNSIKVPEYGKRVGGKRKLVDCELADGSELRSLLRAAAAVTDVSDFIQEFFVDNVVDV